MDTLNSLKNEHLYFYIRNGEAIIGFYFEDKTSDGLDRSLIEVWKEKRTWDIEKLDNCMNDFILLKDLGNKEFDKKFIQNDLLKLKEEFTEYFI